MRYYPILYLLHKLFSPSYVLHYLDICKYLCIQNHSYAGPAILKGFRKSLDNLKSKNRLLKFSVFDIPKKFGILKSNVQS